ncbi:MAG: hypothetical protein C0593_08075 [Marinilabiliales bacterium]|nr:MAG: hypothetical protein C0593_08075 [Marinilabiliales bacterium]
MKKLYFLISLLLIMSACTKVPEVHVVRYEADKATSALSISWMDENGALQQTTQDFNSTEDSWSFTGTFEEGDIIYLSGTYSEEGGSQRLRILIDGKAVRQGENEYLPGEQGRITLSGVVPIE